MSLMQTLVSRWIAPVAPSGAYQRVDYVVLGLIVAVGAWLRFWALGDASLHGDEDIMALAARGLIEHGIPIMPSGMVYVRAPVQLYLIAGSMQLFGDSEWSIRLPSAVVGSLCGLLAFLFGKRFLGPRANLAFVALVSFLPIMIEISKTGRMYVFFIACLLLFGTLVFKWERTGRWPWLALALVVWIVAFQFHALAMFALPVFLFPGLANGSARQLIAGVVAFGLAAPIYLTRGYLMERFYPGPDDRLPEGPRTWQPPLELVFQDRLTLALVAITAIAAVVAAVILLARSGAGRANSEARLASLLLAVALLAFAALQYHLGAIALVLGGVLWFRSGLSFPKLVLVVCVVIAMAAVQAMALNATGQYPGVKLLRAMLGVPSIVPMIRLTEFTLVGIAVYLLALGFALTAIARGRAVPAHFLFFVMTVWLPLLAIGVFRWDFPARYLVGVLPFFLVGVIAGLEYVGTQIALPQQWRQQGAAKCVVALAILATIINPVAAYDTARNDHSMYPDHRGAAEFVRSATTGGDAILIAEDSITQTYYLGWVDYRLLNVEVARTHSVLSNGRLKGQYTGATIIGSGSELIAILDGAPPRPVFIIGAGQYSGAGGARARANGIREVLSSERLELVYIGRDDGKTQVWRLKQ